MKPKPSLERQKFPNDWDAVEDAYQKLLYWLYDRGSAAKAVPYAKRLEQILQVVDPAHESILGEECWSLIYEAQGDIKKAIEYRENEIRLMHRLHELSGALAPESIALEGRGYEHLSERLDLLATLYHAAGNLDRAISLLNESKQLCGEHGLEFDGSDLLAEYLAEMSLTERA